MVGMDRNSSDPSFLMTPQPEEQDTFSIRSAADSLMCFIDRCYTKHPDYCECILKELQKILRQAAERVAEKERERCAKIAERFQDVISWQEGESRNKLCLEIAAAIRSGQGEGV